MATRGISNSKIHKRENRKILRTLNASRHANCFILVFTAEQIYDKYIYKGEDLYAYRVMMHQRWDLSVIVGSQLALIVVSPTEGWAESPRDPELDAFARTGKT